MNYKWKLPTEVISKKQCVINNDKVFASLGKRAIIVTGHYSAKSCGALEDVLTVCNRNGIEVTVFDEIENNPSLETVVKGSEAAKACQAEFVIGIGGGSPLDAAKAIAVLAGNEMGALELFKNQFQTALPIIAIPTTAGTGSEVTPYSVILRTDMQTKVSFGNEKTFPAYALIDSKYICSLNRNSTVNTAVDAFTHVFEGYLCNRATVLSDALAMDAIRVFGECFEALLTDKVTEEIREKLMYVSLMGGIVIAHTGVTIVHGMGYCLTYFKEIPHGRANGLLLKAYLDYIYDVKKEKIDLVMQLLHCRSRVDFTDKLEGMIGKAPLLSEDEVEQYTELTMLQGAHGGTFGGNPVACAAALATIDVLQNGAVENAAAMGEYFKNELEKLAAAFQCIGEVRGLGLMLAIELVKEEKLPDSELTAKLKEKVLEKNVLLLTCGTYKNVIRFIAPATVTKEEIHMALLTVRESLLELQK